MRIHLFKRSLLFVFIIFAVQSMAYSQCLVYGFRQKYSESGYKSHSGVNTGYYLIGPKQVMQDSLTRYPIITFYLNSSKSGKYYYCDTNSPIDGTPSSGGILIGLVKQDKSLKVLATKKDAGSSQSNPFDGDTLSGAATYQSGYGYIAATLSATYSSWFPNYYYYTNSYPLIGDSTLTEPVNVYKYTGSETCTLNVNLTLAVKPLPLKQATDLIMDRLRSMGYQTY